MPAARTFTLARRPHGTPVPGDFRLETRTLPDPQPGEVLLQTLWLSLDPYMRGRMNAGASYAPGVGIGAMMPGEVVARVLLSRDPGFAPGDVVVVHDGWRDHSVHKAGALRKPDARAAPVQTALGVLGMPGMTAYTGLATIGKPQPGETLVVAAATGAVGSLVGQLARRAGCRVVGVAGGAQKCAYAVEVLGFDACIDHRDPEMAAQLASACPNGIDVYFELVGGAVWNAVLPLLNLYARVPVCGTIASYNDTAPPPGPDRAPALLRTILVKSLTLRGFIVSEFAAQAGAFHRDMGQWWAAGQIHWREDVTEGLENAPETFIGMLSGRNFGKVLIRVAE